MVREEKNLQQALANPEFTADGATNAVDFLPSGDRNLRGTLIEIQPGKRSGTGYDFVALDDKNTPGNATLNPVSPTTSPRSPSK